MKENYITLLNNIHNTSISIRKNAKRMCEETGFMHIGHTTIRKIRAYLCHDKCCIPAWTPNSPYKTLYDEFNEKWFLVPNDK